MKPNVVSRQSEVGDTIHVNLHKVCDFLRKKGITIDQRTVNHQIAGISGANINFRTSFENDGRQHPCIKIPHSAFPPTIVEDLDESMLYLHVHIESFVPNGSYM